MEIVPTDPVAVVAVVVTATFAPGLLRGPAADGRIVGVVVTENPIAAGSVQGQRVIDTVWPPFVWRNQQRGYRDPESTADLRRPAVEIEQGLEAVIRIILLGHTLISTS
jgi:hypothetical protein